MADALRINEVGPRDGLQNQATPIVTADKLRLIAALANAGLRRMEATSFVSPKAVPQMSDADVLFPQLGQFAGVLFSALVPNERGLARAMAAGVQEVAVVLSATDTMNQRNINTDLTQAQQTSADTVRAAVAAGLRCKAYVAVAFECPFEGPVSPQTVLNLSQAMFQAGAHEVVIADTIGAAAPRDVALLSRQAVDAFGAGLLAIHLHDTRGMAVANAWAAMQAGIQNFDASVGGLGGCPFAPGAAGNLATEDLVLLAQQCGFVTGISLPRLLQAVEVAQSVVGKALGGRSSAWLRKQAVVA